MTKTRFRALLIFYLGISSATLLAGLLNVAGYSTTLASAYAAEPNDLIDRHPWPLLAGAALLIAAALAGMVGLYRFTNWGRTVSLYVTVAALVLTPLAGPMLLNPVEGALSQAASVLSGALMAIAYFSPLSGEFSRRMPAPKPRA
ncbi:MAG: hypothetical protein QFF03_23545 [Pseudomonadota bacterium]|nr:hypothetical protein [Pseudomonadota bacterium]